MKSPWPTKKLGEICEERKEKNVNNENLPVFTVSHIYGLIPYQNIFYKQVHSKDTKNYKIVNRYDFAFGLPTKDTLPYGLLESEDKVLVSPAYIVFTIKDKNLLITRFLYYLLKTNYYKWKIIEMAKSHGATRHGLPLKFHHLANLEIPFPSLPIQQKIVKILDTIQSAVEIQEKIIEKTKELKKSLMAELFKCGTLSFRKGRKLKKTEIGEIPEDWEVVRLGKYIKEMIRGVNFKVSELVENHTEMIPILRATNMGENDLILSNLIYVPSYKVSQKQIVRKNDIILVASSGSKNLVGRSVFIRNEPLSNLAIGAFLYILRVEENYLSPFYLYLYVSSGKFERYLSSLVGGTNINNLQKFHIENFQIPLPSLPEQQEIAEILQTIDQKIEIEKKKKELYEELFKTMLNKIMSQEINVEKIEV
jgi:type I restriction enzyme S subunit